ncbi:hypothetical protein [Dyella sp.]|jgi:hypothetical protein|uniref:hypothetical protein n=1 Tax=Dyella sp. TaxID=1869338 RepID=UPI002D784479|nr:hypothetical protein [Dyella sp.]HET6432361.1 hypothetical protein [Dyella sp.]
MRYTTLIATLLLAGAAAPPANAGWYVQMHSTTESLSWKGAHGQALELSSEDGKGITVGTILPDGHDGLHKGDRITAIDGHAVSHVQQLLAYANAHMQDPARLSVHGGGHDIDVALPAGELGALMHPHP